MGTRLDLSHVVCIVAQFYQQPRHIHVTIVKRILHYLHDIVHFTLCYGGEHNINTRIIYFDVDWAHDLDDKKSKSGCKKILNQVPICWISQK
jgi:hypothetical protein